MAARSASASTAKPGRPRKSRKLMLMILGAVLLWAAVAYMEQSESIREQKGQLQTLKQRLEEVQAENELFKLEVQRLKDPEYIEQKVRKDFGMTRPGDKVFESGR